MENTTKKLLVVGSLNIDLVSQVEQLPLPGQTITSEKFYVNPGGKGANQAVAAAKLGAEVSMIGRVGSDNYGTVLLNNLQQSGVHTENIQLSETTGMAFIAVDGQGENHIVLVPGANNEMSIEDIDKYENVIKSSDIIILQLEIPLNVVEYVIELAGKLGKKVILNPAPAQKLSPNLLKGVHTLIPNETELAILTDMPTSTQEEIVAAAKYLKSIGIEEVVVTMGGQGSYLINNDCEVHIPAEKVEVVDTTAAGDSYIGAFAVGQTNGMSSVEAAQFASKVAAITVTREGAQSSLPSLEEVKQYQTVNC
ncbi:ribokinase [Bacillus sp. B15-48]|uniref:ribokinase n=1 Tax=Bacillus sp. B15-48 TaxID=1548601 RepID=UPI00193FF919|nr:ribokinase [Bacillus sp. B15-48]MBM4761241.1 ribokinase [Bacillus sp. B15-48]